MEQTERPASAGQLPVVLWGCLLFGLTGLGIVPLYLFHVDLSHFSGNLPAPQLAVLFVGIELTAYAPTLAALLVVWRLREPRGIRRLLGQALRWRIHPGWYVLALLGPIPLFLLRNAIWVLLGGHAPAQWVALPTGRTGQTGFVFTIGAIIAGAVGEEFGWRGFAQPRLQRLTGALAASVVIGALWATWHLWPVVVPGGASLFSLTDYPQTYVRLIATAIVYAWIYNATGGSLLAVMLAHAGHNLGSTLIQDPPDGPHAVPIITALLYLAVALVVVIFTNHRTLTRSALTPRPTPAPSEPPPKPRPG